MSQFTGTGKRLSPGDIGDAARTLGVETAVLLAFLEVEAAGRGFDNLDRPKMLFEPHVFWRNLSGKLRDAAAAAGLAYAKWKAGGYPKDSYPRLEKAIAISKEPAFRSASYGLPQILGENHKAAGFVSAEQMFTVFKQGEREQLLAMVTLMQSWGMTAMLTGKDFTKPDSWRPAAGKYNGAGYATHGYHTNLAAAYTKHKDGEAMAPAETKPRTVLTTGMKGEDVLAMQKDLAALGYEIVADGRFGPATEAAVKDFQKSYGLPTDGKAGPKTLHQLDNAVAAAASLVEPPVPLWTGQEPAVVIEPPLASPPVGDTKSKLLWLAASAIIIAIVFFIIRRGG